MEGVEKQERPPEPNNNVLVEGGERDENFEIIDDAEIDQARPKSMEVDFFLSEYIPILRS